jgi:ABC-2 type transport system ATP-binding protein
MSQHPAIEITDLHRSFGKTDAVRGVNITVAKGRCYGLFGRNGAGKTTTIKCLLNLLRPHSGSVRIFGMDPQRHEVAVKSRLAYVPDSVGFHAWMRVTDVLEYFASFRKHWNANLQSELIERFRLDPGQKANDLSKGQKMQLALIAAVCPEPDLLLLDEPTTGLDPIARREFMESVIGAYQDAAPGERTIFVSTHLIAEFEGLIDEFTIVDEGRDILTMESDAARKRFIKARARFTDEAPDFQSAGVIQQRRDGRELELILNGNRERIMAEIRALNPIDITEEALSLEEIFLTARNAKDIPS